MPFNLRARLCLEDNGPNVEINFNIDNDNDETPIDVEKNVEDNSDITDDNENITNEEDKVKADAIEAQAEELRSETEVEELEEAQEALESLKLILNKTHRLSIENFEMFQLVMRNVSKEKSYLETVSTETIFQSDYHRKLVAEELVNASLENLTIISLEAKESLWERVKDKLARFKDLEQSIVRKANALRELASEHRHEKADIEYIKFDDKNVPKFKYLRSNKINSFSELVKDIKLANTFFTHLKMPNIGAGDDKAIIDSMTNFNEGWKLNNGVDTIEFFNLSIKKGDNLVPDTRPADKDIEQLPILNATECEEVLELVLALSKHRGKVEQLSGILKRLDKSSSKFQYAAKAAYVGIRMLQDIRVNIMDELVKYCQLSISHLNAD